MGSSSLPVKQALLGARRLGVGILAWEPCRCVPQLPCPPFQPQSTNGASCPNSSQPPSLPQTLSQLPRSGEEVKGEGSVGRTQAWQGETKSPCFAEGGGACHPSSPRKHLSCLEPTAFQGWAIGSTGQAHPPPWPPGPESPLEQGKSHRVENQNPESGLACPPCQDGLQISPLETGKTHNPKTGLASALNWSRLASNR